MNIEITEMLPTDLEEITNCLLTEFDDFWSPSVLMQELENKQNLNSHYFVAKTYIQNTSKYEIAGFIGVLTIIDEMNIMNIVVRKSKRSLGIGSSLIKYIIDLAKKENLSSITLEVNEKNIFAINLYKKFNFKQVGIRKKYYNNIHSALLMTLSLK